VLLCAGAYVAGAAGSNECPAGSVRIETEAACRTAAATAGKTVSSYPPFVETRSNYPRGCYYQDVGNQATFNNHVVGNGDSSAKLLCDTTVTTGAPSPPPMRERRRQRHCECECRTSTCAIVCAFVAVRCCSGTSGQTHSADFTSAYVHMNMYIDI
jgi:hypothetical protein